MGSLRQRAARAKQLLRLSLRRRRRKHVQSYRSVEVNGRNGHLHRFIAEIMLGRKLRRTEHVHHIDGNKDNNHPSNLEILTAEEHGFRTSGPKQPFPRCVICGRRFRHQRVASHKQFNHARTCSRHCGLVLTWRTSRRHQRTRPVRRARQRHTSALYG